MQIDSVKANLLNETSCLLMKESVRRWRAHGSARRSKAANVVVGGEITVGGIIAVRLQSGRHDYRRYSERNLGLKFEAVRYAIDGRDR